MVSVNEQIVDLEIEITTLKKALWTKEEELKRLSQKEESSQNGLEESITKRDIIRYSRQILVPEVGLIGQVKLKHLSVLIVGVGGLGCPAAQYLAGAGVGRLGLLDYDVVEENNLHRQLLHNEEQLGRSKVASAATALKKINSQLIVDEYMIQLSSSNALDIVSQYNVVVDASDNVATRYLVNDACVLARKPLVSGSALQLEGQLTIYNYNDGPCYRCLFPQPPPPETVSNCSDAGVLGAVPGVIGTLQALEVIKIALGVKDVLSSKLLLFDGVNTTFRTINLRKKNQNCPACGTTPSITKLIDYEQFCGAAANDKDKHLNILNESDRITSEELNTSLTSTSPCIVIDVRQEAEFQMCRIPNSVNIPLKSLEKSINQIQCLAAERLKSNSSVLVCMVCRRGNDSQLAVKTLQPLLPDEAVLLKDLKGGLHGWASAIDPSFPVY